MSIAEEQLRTTAGRPLGAEHAARVRAGERIRVASVRRNIPPVDEGDIVEVAAASHPARGDIALCRAEQDYELRRLLRRTPTGWLARAEPAGNVVTLPPSGLVGLVDAVEQGDIRIELRRRRWRACARLLAALPAVASGLGHGLARLERIRRPVFPPVRMGPEAALLAGVRCAYEREAHALDGIDELADVERDVLASWLRPGMRMLDVGAGTGREALAFTRAGLDVTAIDVAASMVDRARERAAAAGIAVSFAVADVTTYEPERRFDVVYLGTGVYNHIPTRARRVATLRHVSRLLERGGFIVLASVMFPPLPLLSRSHLVDVARRVLRAAGVRNVAEPGDAYHRGFALEPAPHAFRYVHRFTRRAAIEAEIRAADLVVLDRREDAAVWKVGRRASASA